MKLPCLHRPLRCLGRWVIPLALGILLFFPGPGQAASCAGDKKTGLQQGRGYRGKQGLQGRTLIAKRRKKDRAPRTEEELERYLRNHQNLSPEEKARLKRKYKRWKSLDPDEQKALRSRQKKFQDLGPEDRRLYEQIFRQWRNLTPQQRKRIRENLDKGNGLTGEEKEEIRQMFR